MLIISLRGVHYEFWYPLWWKLKAMDRGQKWCWCRGAGDSFNQPKIEIQRQYLQGWHYVVLSEKLNVTSTWYGAQTKSQKCKRWTAVSTWLGLVSRVFAAQNRATSTRTVVFKVLVVMISGWVQIQMLANWSPTHWARGPGGGGGLVLPYKSDRGVRLTY